MMMAIMLVMMLMIIMMVMLIEITIKIMNVVKLTSLNVMQIKMSFAAAYDFNQLIHAVCSPLRPLPALYRPHRPAPWKKYLPRSSLLSTSILPCLWVSDQSWPNLHFFQYIGLHNLVTHSWAKLISIVIQDSLSLLPFVACLYSIPIFSNIHECSTTLE